MSSSPLVSSDQWVPLPVEQRKVAVRSHVPGMWLPKKPIQKRKSSPPKTVAVFPGLSHSQIENIGKDWEIEIEDFENTGREIRFEITKRYGLSKAETRKFATTLTQELDEVEKDSVPLFVFTAHRKRAEEIVRDLRFEIRLLLVRNK